MSPVPPGHVEDRLAGARAHPTHERRFPQPMLAARHEVVHQIVARSDAREDGADAARLFLRRDILMAERNLVHRAAL